MQSVSGLDLVSGALKSTLARAQRSYDFNSPNSKLNQKKNRKTKQIVCGDRQEGQNDGIFNHWNIAVKSNKIQFAPSGYQLSNFIETIRSKYECLNPRHPENTLEARGKSTPLKRQHLLKSQVSNKLLENICAKEQKCKSEPKQSTAKPKDDDANLQKRSVELNNHIQGETIFDSKALGNPNPYELFQRFKERRKEIRKKRKEIRQLAQLEKLRASQPKLFEPDRVKENSSNNHLSKRGQLYKEKKMKETADNSGCVANCINSSNSNQLSQPRIVLFPRNKVVPGWKQRFPIGCGLINLGNSCYMNASLQALFHTPAFVNWLLDDNEHRQNCRNSGQCFQSCIICAMYSTLKESLNRQNQCLRPLQIHNKLKVICKHFTHGRQEDAHEFLRYLLESMERSYLAAINSLRLDNRSKETTPLGQIFGGYLRTEVICLKCNFVSTTFQPLAELQLDIRHVTTLEDAIQNHFKKERLDNNDYKCEKCHSISPATKQFSLEIPPIVLCLQLKRFTLYGNKITKPIHCNRSLNLTRYLHKSHQEVGQGEIRYRLVGLVTHMGSSPNCGHYTAIAEASNGNFYQFDDSFVRQVSVQTALNTDAYVIVYEMDRNQSHSAAYANVSNANYGVKSAVTASIVASTAVSTNGSTNKIGRIGSPLPSPKKFTVPFIKSPASDSSSLRNAMTTPSPNPSSANENSNPNFSSNSKLINGSHTVDPGINQNRDKISFDVRQPTNSSLTSNSVPKINILKPGAVLTNTFTIPVTNGKDIPKLGLSSNVITTNGEKRPKSPLLTNGMSNGTHKQTIQLVPYDNDDIGDSIKVRRKEKTPEKAVGDNRSPVALPKASIDTPTSNKFNSSSNSGSQDKIVPTLQLEQQYGVKRKLEEVLGRKESIHTDNKQPRICISTPTKDSTSQSDKKLRSTSVDQPVSATSSWKVIANSKQSSVTKCEDGFRKSSSSKVGGYSSDPESKLNNGLKHVDYFRSKSAERLVNSPSSKTDPTKIQSENLLKCGKSEKQRKSTVVETHSNLVNPNANKSDHVSKRKHSVPYTNGITNGFASHSEEKSVGEHNGTVKVALKSRSRSSSSSTSSDGSDEKHRSKSNRHKKRSKKSKFKAKKAKKHRKKDTSSSSSSLSCSDTEDEKSELIKKKHKKGMSKLKEERIKKINSPKRYKTTKRGVSPDTASTDLSEGDNRNAPKSTTYTQLESLEISRSMSEERERDRRKNRNPSRSPDRKVCLKEDKFEPSKLLSRDKQIVGWNGTESLLSKAIDTDRQKHFRKSKDDLYDEDIDSGRVKKMRKSNSPSREDGSSGNKFQNYEDKRREVRDWSKILDGYGQDFRGNKHTDKSNGKSSSSGSDFKDSRGSSNRYGNSFGSSHSGSYNSHRNRSDRSGMGRGAFKNRHTERRNGHQNSYRRNS